MDEIIKVCKKHGALTIDKVRYEKDRGKIQSRCKLCRKETALKVFKKYRKKKMEYISKWKKANRERINARTNELRRLNPEMNKASRDREKIARKRDWYRRTGQAIASKRGITFDEYEKLYASQNGLCAICNKKETRQIKGKVMRLTLDHCHKTDRNRKFLCHMCNVGIGSLRDDINLMAAAIEYIKEHS